MRALVFALVLLAPQLVSSIKEDDLITLPGLTFQPNFKTYAGYLNANNDTTWKMHYFLTESKSNPDTDPLLLWFNGGPGCASLGGMFEELGPFYVNPDGATLYENVYSWNAKANVLALDSPIGVGFSYSTKVQNFTDANDMQTAEQNYAALKDFFVRVQPKYANRTFFLSGESYAGIYIPMLSKLLVERINNGDFPNKNFQGAAIGNGFMHVQHLMNSLVLWSAYHGGISQDDWDQAKTECKTGQETDHDKYNYQQFMYSTNGMDYFADNSTCGQLIGQLITQTPAGPSIDFDQYNYYQDCYVLSGKDYSVDSSRKNILPAMSSSNTAQMTNYESVDNQWGYPCDNGGLTRKYFRRPEVLDAMKVDKAWRDYFNGTNFYAGCNDPMYDLYTLTYNNTQQFFDYVIQNSTQKDFRFLIYNGDVDTVCNYLGDSWFIREVATANGYAKPQARNFWTFGKQLAGYVQRYTGKVNIDVLTVKGAGHFVPNDRPGPSLQMITNFMFPVDNTAADAMYSSEKNLPSSPKFSTFASTNSGFVSNYFFAHTLAVFMYLLAKL